MIVIFSPEDLKIVKDEPEKRRRFIDRELCQIQPRYYDSLSNYKKTLQQRNAYLKEERIDPSMLDLWDLQLAKYGARIMELRDRFIKKISVFSGAIHSSITAGQETLFLEYNPNVALTDDREQLEGFFYDEIKRAFPGDCRHRTTTRGPHKDDISFYVGGINMAQLRFPGTAEDLRPVPEAGGAEPDQRRDRRRRHPAAGRCDERAGPAAAGISDQNSEGQSVVHHHHGHR